MTGQNDTTAEQLQVELTHVLKKAAGLLDRAGELRNEVVSICNFAQSSAYRVAVFGPFNYGKSTLLNALLGERTLPMDLVPTTGAAIAVKYGPKQRTQITYTDGSKKEETGTDALERFAILDERRQMRADVAAVDVYCPHPLLKLGIELVDLPGTDDQQAQNNLVQNQLLSADLVIQVLDGRKLMTLAEREHLRDWLLDRGINSVIFVVNFLNLMEAGDRQQVSSRLRFLAESFRADLPPGVSNLYQVDALPALRARLKGDAAAAAKTGLPALESALQLMGQQVDESKTSVSHLSRIEAVVPSVIAALQAQIAASEARSTPSVSRRAQIQEKARSLIGRGFNQDITKLRNWLKPENLKAHYRRGLAQALAEQTAAEWIVEHLRPGWRERQKPVIRWVHQACEFFDCPRPADLWMAFSSELVDRVAAKTSEATDSDWATDSKLQQRPGMAPVAIATGLGWILGGPMGAAVFAGTSHIVNNRGSKRQSKSVSSNTSVEVDFEAQADIYLDRFSKAALASVVTYEQQANSILTTWQSSDTEQSDPSVDALANLTKTTIAELEEMAKKASASRSSH